MAKQRRSAAQRAATKKLVTFNRTRGRAPAKRKRRRNPVATRRRRAYRATPLAAAPAPRRRRRAPARVINRVRRRRRNQAPTARNIMNKMVMPAVQAATGAIALDMAWANLPIPINLKAGPMKHVAKGLGAVAISWLGGMLPIKQSTADTMAMGALTVVTYNWAREMMAEFAPQVVLDGTGYYPGNNAGNNMGFYNPALPAGGYEGPGLAYYPPGNQAVPQNAEMGYYAENSY